MSSNPLLTEQDLEQLTHLKRPMAQARWLRKLGIRYHPRNDGTIATTWDAVNAPLLQDDRTRPNLSAVKKAG